jgi:hypothetical protein
MNDLILLLQQVKDRWGYETVEAIKAKLSTSGYSGGPLSYTGNLISSIGYTLEDGLDSNVQFSMADYGQYVDEGTGIFGPKQQAIPKESIPGMAFYLKPWADSKGLNSWAVATSIVNKGGLERRDFFKSIIEIRLDQLKIDLDTAYQLYLDNLIINNQQRP